MADISKDRAAEALLALKQAFSVSAEAANAIATSVVSKSELRLSDNIRGSVAAQVAQFEEQYRAALIQQENDLRNEQQKANAPAPLPSRPKEVREDTDTESAQAMQDWLDDEWNRRQQGQASMHEAREIQEVIPGTSTRFLCRNHGFTPGSVIVFKSKNPSEAPLLLRESGHNVSSVSGDRFSVEVDTTGLKLSPGSFTVASVIGVSTPIDHSPPTSRQLYQTAKLKEELDGEAPLDPPGLRWDAFRQLHELLITWVRTQRPQPEQDPAPKGREVCALYPAGAFGLRVLLAGCTADVVAMMPGCVTWSAVREELFSFLLMQDPVIALRMHEECLQAKLLAFVMHLQVEGGEPLMFQLLFCLLPDPLLPIGLDVTTTDLGKNLDAESRRTLDVIRVCVLVLEDVPNVPQFQLCLRVIKHWAMRRHVYSAEVGYLSGVTCAIMTARLCQLFPNASASFLLSRFFRVFDRWDWRHPVLLRRFSKASAEWFPPLWGQFETDDGAEARAKDSQDPQPAPKILTPTNPSWSCANMNRCARRVLKSELKRGLRKIRSRSDDTAHTTIAADTPAPPNPTLAVIVHLLTAGAAEPAYMAAPFFVSIASENPPCIRLTWKQAGRCTALATLKGGPEELVAEISPQATVQREIQLFTIPDLRALGGKLLELRLGSIPRGPFWREAENGDLFEMFTFFKAGGSTGNRDTKYAKIELIAKSGVIFRQWKTLTLPVINKTVDELEDYPNVEFRPCLTWVPSRDADHEDWHAETTFIRVEVRPDFRSTTEVCEGLADRLAGAIPLLLQEHKVDAPRDECIVRVRCFPSGTGRTTEGVEQEPVRTEG
mmetsp:Transcript_114324/g.262346  ORF Transcript_114324/g.262346 Transcript_114324/m.262346 type:complete len:831 (+) Transcript_114324:82-2574(+)